MSEYADVYEKKQVVARKPHKCCECFITIKKGDPYNTHSGLYDGRWFREKDCYECDDLRRSINLDTDWNVAFGGLDEAVSEYEKPEDNDVINFLERLEGYRESKCATKQ